MSERAARRDWGYWGYAAIGAVTLVYAVVLVRTAWLCDDSYITFRTVGNFISGYGLRWNIDERVQAYTHPLWMFLLSGLFCLTANIYYSAIFSSIVLSLAAVLVYAFGVARTAWHAVLGLTILLFSKAFVDYSTSGLENPLSYLLVALFVMLYLRDRRASGIEHRASGIEHRASGIEHRASGVGRRGSGNDNSNDRSGNYGNRNNNDAAEAGTANKGPADAGVLSIGPPEDATPYGLLQLSLLAGLIAVNRMDLILLVGPALAHAFWRVASCHSARRPISHSRRSRPPRASEANRGEESGRSSLLRETRAKRAAKVAGLVLLGFAPFIAWEIFSIIYYGFPFPNTAYAKLNTGIPAGDLIRQGLYYLSDSLRNDRVTLAAVACAIVAAGLSRQGRKIAIASGILLYLLYTVRIGGDFMSGRYFAVPLLASVAILGTMELHGRGAKAGWSVGMLATVAVGLLSPNPSLLTGGAYGLVGDDLVNAHGIADERGWYYIFTGLLRSNPKWGHRILREAQKARQSGDTVVVSADTIGLFGYNVGPNVHIVDVFALADPLLARLPMKPSPRWRIGHFERDVPEGYVASLRTGRNELVDPQMRALYDQIVLVTRGPLFSWARWAAIWRLNVRGHLHESTPVCNMPRV